MRMQQPKLYRFSKSYTASNVKHLLKKFLRRLLKHLILSHMDLKVTTDKELIINS